jgi:hypothetical protein
MANPECGVLETVYYIWHSVSPSLRERETFEIGDREKPHTAIPAFIYGLSFLLQIYRARIILCAHCVLAICKKFATAAAPLLAGLFIKGHDNELIFRNCFYTSQ